MPIEEYETDKDDERRYCDNLKVDSLVRNAEDAVRKTQEPGKPIAIEGARAMRKTVTEVKRASVTNAAARHKPGQRLRTYTGKRGTDGKLLDETYGGEATVADDGVIYRNREPVTDEKTGAAIVGTYQADGTFVEGDASSPDAEILYNEYCSNTGHAGKKYGLTVFEEDKWEHAAARIPSYLIPIPPDVGPTHIRSSTGQQVSVKGGDFIVIDALGKGEVGVQAIAKDWADKTYTPW